MSHSTTDAVSPCPTASVTTTRLKPALQIVQQHFSTPSATVAYASILPVPSLIPLDQLVQEDKALRWDRTIHFGFAHELSVVQRSRVFCQTALWWAAAGDCVWNI